MSSSTQKSTVPRPSPALRLVDVLRQLPPSELESLIRRLKIGTDEAKRIDVPSQVARALVILPEVRDPSLLPAATRELLNRIAESKGNLVVESLPPAIEPLVAKGIAYARAVAGGVELILPIAFMCVLPTWEGEDPRGLRALIAQASPEVMSSIASHFLGRPATPPLALSLEPAWESLMRAASLKEAVEALAPLERKLLRAVEKVGGEVDTEELLDLEREPMRLRGATGVTPSRRGVGFALERRAFLVPVHPNRHVVPSEVAAIVGAQRRAEREAQRREIRSFVFAEDHEPRRARFAEDPVPLALAMALAVCDPGVEVRSGVGTPRSLVARFASRFGRTPEAVALIASLSRAVGLWDASVVSVTAPPGSLRLDALAGALFDAWRRGGAWDEARPDGEVLRSAGEPSTVGVVREMVLEALRELGDGNWAPWEAVAAYVRADSRTPGVARLIERWAQRAGFEPKTPAEIARRIAFESLHVLGVVDLGDPDTHGVEPTLRITPRGRAFLTGEAPAQALEPSRFLDGHELRLGGAVRVGQAVALAPFVEVGSIERHLDVILTPQSLSQSLAAGVDPELIRGRLEQIAQLPDPIERLLTQASAVVGRAELVPTLGFLWVDDPEIRELLRTRRQTADLFVEPSPPGGLLVASTVDVDRLARRCRSLGVEVLVDGAVHRARTSAPPGRSSGSSAMLRAVNERKASGTRARPRRSSTSLPAAKRGSGS
ncbi:MAG: hypothetical protein OZ928_16355 [Polyangiaceae bacterium]|nr:hypothetical protein [Polyangiaceae bacterium]